jgi:NDP-sugar pyrophosphorylase family protein
VLDQLASAGMAEVVLLIGVEAERVRGTLGKTYENVRLVYSEEPSPLGTAGAVRWALPQLSASTILLLNGDSYCDVNLAAFAAFHEHHAADASLVLAHVPNAASFGRVRTDGQNWIAQFVEKTEAAEAGWINAGIYLLERGLIEAIPAGRTLSLERELFPAWVAQRRCCGFPGARRFLDIGTPDSYAQAELFFMEDGCRKSLAMDQPTAPPSATEALWHRAPCNRASHRRLATRACP